MGCIMLGIVWLIWAVCNKLGDGIIYAREYKGPPFDCIVLNNDQS